MRQVEPVTTKKHPAGTTRAHGTDTKRSTRVKENGCLSPQEGRHIKNRVAPHSINMELRCTDCSGLNQGDINALAIH